MTDYQPRTPEHEDSTVELPAIPEVFSEPLYTVADVMEMARYTAPWQVRTDVAAWKYKETHQDWISGISGDRGWVTTGHSIITEYFKRQGDTLEISSTAGASGEEFVRYGGLEELGLDSERATALRSQMQGLYDAANIQTRGHLRRCLEEICNHPAFALRPGRRLEDVARASWTCNPEDLSAEYWLARFDEQVESAQHKLPPLSYDYLSAAKIVQDIHSTMPEAIERYTRQQTGGILVYFTGSRRYIGTNNRQGTYVIAADGSLRRSDGGLNGTSVWQVVEAGEAAVKWGRDTQFSAYKCDIVKPPAEGLTSAQQATLRGLEREHNMPEGAWETDENLLAVRQEVIEHIYRDEDISQLLAQCDAERAEDGSIVNLYNQLLSTGGLHLGEFFHPIGNGADNSIDHEVDGREGTEARYVQINNELGVQVVSYYKYGHDNTALRLVEGCRTSSAQAHLGSTAMQAATLDDLKARFNSL